jgi:endonuclease/exonuclease/phosphatase family metal-dependent hydrolase
MRVMTLNIWNYEPAWERRRSAIVGLIGDSRPHVVALQECRHDFRHDHGRDQGEQIADLSGYRPTSAVAQVYLPLPRIDEGLTVLTRDDVEVLGSDVRALTLFSHLRLDENHRICLAVSLRVGTQKVHVIDTHFSLAPGARLVNAREAASFAADIGKGEPLVLMGDLNAEPDSPEIEYMTSEGGFTDAWTAGGGELPGYTYASFNPVRRIDYIMTMDMPGDPRAVQLVGTEPLDGVLPSDHLGILADLPV